MVKENDGNKHDEQAMFIDSEQARIRTCFHRFTEIGQIFSRDIFLVKKKLMQLEILFHNYNMEIDHDKILRFARLH